MFLKSLINQGLDLSTKKNVSILLLLQQTLLLLNLINRKWQYQIKNKGKKRYWMRKNLSREGGKNFVYNACQRFTVFWQRIFLQELQNGHKDIRGFTFLDNCSYSNVFYTEITCNPCGGTLCYFTVFNLSEHLWTTASTWGSWCGLTSGW